jgi:hypothetical protein
MWLPFPDAAGPLLLYCAAAGSTSLEKDTKSAGLTRMMQPQNAEEAAEIKRKRTFRKFSYRGIDLDAYVSLLSPTISIRDDWFTIDENMGETGKGKKNILHVC